MVTLNYLADHPQWLSVLSDWPLGSPHDLPDSWTRRLHRYRLPLAFVAVEDGRPLGCAGLLLESRSSPRDRRPRLDVLYVKPEHRRRGIGTTLARRSIRKAAALGHPELRVSSPPEFTGFFERLGWRDGPESDVLVVRTHARRSAVLCSI